MTQDGSVFDAMVPNYRRACDRWPDAPALRKHYKLLIQSDFDDFGLIESIKSFLESVCLTILGDFGHPLPANRPSLTELFTAALKPLGMQNTRGGSSLDRVLSAFNKLADALSDVRNEYGALAHGKHGFFESLTRDENRAFLHTGDAVLAMLLNALEGTSPALASTREPYKRFQHFNDRIDRSVQVSADVDVDSGQQTVVIKIVASGKDDALELRIEPSELLFAIDRLAYVEVVNATARQTLNASLDEDYAPWADTDESVKALSSSAPVQAGSRANLTAEYIGHLSPLRSGLRKFLAGEKLDGSAQVNGMSFLASLLATAEENMALDIWQSETRQARLRVALRRVISYFHSDMNPRSTAEKLVTWLRIQSAGVEALDGKDGSADVSGT